MIFQKPTQEADYFKGLIRNTAVLVTATSSYNYNRYHPNSLIQNSLDNYWCSAQDSTLNQYVDITFLNYSVKVTSYMISSGNEADGYYLKSWIFNCTDDGKDWTTIDSHKNEPEFTQRKQMRIFDTKIVKKCRVFRFIMNGVESMNRYFMYIGPVEFYGTSYGSSSIIKTGCQCKSSVKFEYFVIYLLVC